MRGEHAHRVLGGIAAKLPEARPLVPRVQEIEERGDGSLGALLGSSHGIGEGEHCREPSGGLRRALGIVDEPSRALEVAPEDPERIVHRGARDAVGRREHGSQGGQPLTFGVRKFVVVLDRRPWWLAGHLGRPNQPPRRRRRQPGQVRSQDRLDQAVAIVLTGEPAERQEIRVRRGLGEEREPALRHDAGNARVVQRAEQAADVRPVPSNDHRHLAPWDALLHMHTTQLPGDGGVLLGGVSGQPRIGRHGQWRSVPDGEVDLAHALVRIGEASQRDVGRALEREDVRGEVPRDRQAPPGEVGHQRLLGQRRVLIIVHQDVVEEGIVIRRQLGRPGGLCDEAREVDLPCRGEHVEVATVEPCELAPPGGASLGGPGKQLVRCDERFLRPLQELADLVGETAKGEHRSERRPLRGVLRREQLTDPCVLVERSQRRRRRAIPEGPEPQRGGVVRQPVDGEDGCSGERTP